MTHQGTGQGAAHREHKAVIAHAQGGHLFAPLLDGAALLEWVFGQAIGLVHDAFTIGLAQCFAGQHVGAAMPPQAIHAPGHLGGLAGLKVLGKPVACIGAAGNA